MTSNHSHDEEWEDIVRRLGGDPEQGPSDPIVEPSPIPQTPSLETGTGPRDYAVSEEVVEDFQPPEPRSIATGNPRTILSWTGVIGAVAIWLIAALLNIPLAWWLTTVTVVAFLGGALSLFFQLPQTRAHQNPYDDDDYGNGAKL